METRRVDPESLRANKLELVERLADDLAHEIKNPLHSMVINLEVLKRRVARSAAPEATDLMRYVGVLAGELDRVNRRVELLLRMVRPERLGDPIPLTEAVEELLEVVELERERQAIAIEVIPPEHALRANLPRSLGRQIVLNLLVIALDAAGPGGTLTICCAAGAVEDRLRILARPIVGTDHRDLSGVEENGVRRSTVRTLAESLGGRVEIGSPEEEDDRGTEIVLVLPATPS